jgi:3-deoxy-7-phosphoheptulonate synthase
VLRAASLPEQVMIDVSHGNSGKRHEQQIVIATGLAERIAAGERRVFGLMIESHLEAGRQDLVPGRALRRGVSITDACIGFDQTVPLLRSLASAVAARRRRR